MVRACRRQLRCRSFSARPAQAPVFDGLSPAPRPQSPAPRAAFTLVEMLVVVTVIGIMAAMTLGALQLARESSREQATKATIAKLNNIILRQYDSYKTRRVPIRIPPGTTPRQSAEIRLAAIRDLMRMEMPERWNDVSDAPGLLPHIGVPLQEPALLQLYRAKYGGTNPPKNPDNFSHAKCLFMIVSMGNPEAMEQFHQSEIAVDPEDGWQYFVDGWGKPIYFLRWAPGCSSYSDIQSGNAATDPDPFDTRRVDPAGFHLIPLIYSFGRSGADNVEVENDVHFRDPNTSPNVPTTICGLSQYQANGAPVASSATGNIHNHRIEQR